MKVIFKVLMDLPFMGVWAPYSKSFSRFEPEFNETGSKSLNLLLKLAEVPLHILLHHHQTLSVPKCVRRHVNRLIDLRDILVKLIICVFPGHSKIKIANFMKYINFSPIFTFEYYKYYTVAQKHLIVQLTNVLWPINEDLCPETHGKNVQLFWPQRSISSAKIRFSCFCGVWRVQRLKHRWERLPKTHKMVFSREVLHIYGRVA